jgi:hypothetical protein
VLGQDAGFEVAQGGARVDAELVGEPGADAGVGGEGVGLAAGPVQGQDEQFGQAFAKRVLAAPGLQFGGKPGVTAQHQVRGGAGLDRDQGQFVEVGPVGGGEVGVAELGQWLAAPQRKRFA